MGSGKSYYMLRRAQEAEALGYKVYIWDDLGLRLYTRPRLEVSSFAMFWRRAGEAQDL